MPPNSTPEAKSRCSWVGRYPDGKGRFDYGRLPISLAERLVCHLESVAQTLETVGSHHWDDETVKLMVAAVRDDLERIDKQIAQQA